MTNPTYEVMTYEDPESGDLILPFPEELLKSLNWKEGDELEWKHDEKNNTWIIKKKS